ncbi:unnamed protein product [Brachionus calyciflorus]|uniref:Major facilitator superfamily (MFS) profile domain-containing protein n=1 Tax=Brachionus calyciflorus TaxID=104777 RepID=A0A814QI23_9BILA|nr:unnamed protein product [Brachionus calyciflorus]
MDELKTQLGGKGKFQYKTMFFIGIISSFCAMRTYTYNFVYAQPKIIIKMGNQTLNNMTNKQTCEIVNEIENNKNNPNNYKWEFDKTFYHSSIVTDLNLICDKQYLIGLPETIATATLILGFFGGFLGDKIGRKKAILTSLICYTTIILISRIFFLQIFEMSFNFKYVIFALVQILLSACSPWLYGTTFVLLSESTNYSHRTFFSNMNGYFYIMGEYILLLVYYLSRDWKVVYWFIGAYGLLTIISTFFVEESAEWLLTIGNKKKALKIFKKMSRLNGKPLENIEELVDDLQNKSPNEHKSKLRETIKQIKEILSNKNSLVKTLIVSYIWFSLYLSYYGTSLGISSFNFGNPFVLFLVSSSSELIACSSARIVDFIGRKKTMLLFFTIATSMYFSIVVILWTTINKKMSDYSLESILLLVFFIFGKWSVSVLIQTAYIYSSEVYSANIRNTAVLFTSTIGSIGSNIFPYVNLLANVVWKPLPYIVYGISTLLSVIFVLFLPETHQKMSSNIKLEKFDSF